VRLAARGTRDLDGGEEPVEDAAKHAALRRRAREVHVQSLLLATFGTVVAVAFRLLVTLSR
jgi:hypothetical protein